MAIESPRASLARGQARESGAAPDAQPPTSHLPPTASQPPPSQHLCVSKTYKQTCRCRHATKSTHRTARYNRHNRHNTEPAWRVHVHASSDHANAAGRWLYPSLLPGSGLGWGLRLYCCYALALLITSAAGAAAAATAASTPHATRRSGLLLAVPREQSARGTRRRRQDDGSGARTHAAAPPPPPSSLSTRVFYTLRRFTGLEASSPPSPAATRLTPEPLSE